VVKVKVPGWTVAEDQWHRRIGAPAREELAQAGLLR
jgi:hypothetical protein